MPNKPDLGDISKKLNISGIVDNVKSIISPGGVTPKAEEGDVVGLQLAELSLKIQELAAVNAEQAKRLAQVNKLFNAVFDTLKAERDLEIQQAEQAAAADNLDKQADDVSEHADEKDSKES